jgi:hypothetical protein
LVKWYYQKFHAASLGKKKRRASDSPPFAV